ncbi:uncharacterized protein PSFLO_07513 [Pseudozyma flocculosa]|uniref:Uncharacterized protein n=1 Tax=Pseudozyma flocculosa TaxID=84751 RepID=A0A5C3FCN7_9BASI|nr:uncharacterized protein PSFLO_07513 [Pseudozyma flocculosa]
MTSSYSRKPLSPSALATDARNWSHPSSPPSAAIHANGARYSPGGRSRVPSHSQRLGTADSSVSQATFTQQQRNAQHQQMYANGMSGDRHGYPTSNGGGPSSPHSSDRGLQTPSLEGRTRLASNGAAMGPPPHMRPAPLQSHVYGLNLDLRTPAPPLPQAPGEATSSSKKNRPAPHEQNAKFSVELFASQFDQRGYPILSGRAASVKGVLRMPAATGCDVMMKISAHTAAGAPAAVWDGIALAPFDLGEERKVFEVRDRLKANFDLARPRDAFAPRNEAMMEPPSLTQDDFVLPIPFDVKLPLGKATRVVDGELQSVAVPLPPSFEISSKLAAQERREMRMSTKGKTRGLAAKELVEKGFEKVYQIGCYYQITWTLVRDGGAGGGRGASGKKGDKASKGQKEAPAAEGDTLTVPFIFTGEPTTLPPYPPTIPSSLSPKIFTTPGTELGDQWDVHRSTARWSGSLLKTMRRAVDLELHIPSPSIVQAPSHLPMLIIIRPQDPTLLLSTGFREDPIDQLVANGGSDRDRERDRDAESIRTTRSIMSRLIRPSMSLARLSGGSGGGGGGGGSSSGSGRKPGSSGSSIFSSRRPNTAPSTGSSEAGVSDSMTNRTFNPNGAVPDLAGLVCVSLVQTTYCSTEGVNDTPESRRKIVSVADLEEVDVQALLLSSLPGADEPGFGRSAEDIAAINEVSASAKAAGVRVLVGSLTVNQTTPPSFRCQGLEVKYAVKVDLMPANRIGGDGVEKAFRNLGIRSGRSRGLSEGYSTTSSVHTQTQFTQLSNGSTPPTTPPSAGGTTRPFGAARSPGPENGQGEHRPYPSIMESAAASYDAMGSPPHPNEVGVAYSTNDQSAVAAEAQEPQEILSPDVDSVARFPGGPMYHQQRAMPSYPHNLSSGSVSGSSRTGWGSGQSVSEAGYTQSSSFMSEWGKDRKTVSKLHKTIGEMWIDVRVVRAQTF